jgi:hypothetical protein
MRSVYKKMVGWLIMLEFGLKRIRLLQANKQKNTKNKNITLKYPIKKQGKKLYG